MTELKNMQLKQTIFDDFSSKYPDYKIVYLTHYGSILYGTNSESSDIDIKGIFIPTMNDVILKLDPDHYTKNTNNSNEKNSNDDIDCQLFSIYKFFDLLEKGETGSIDILFSMFRNDTIIYSDPKFQEIMIRNYYMMLHKKLNAFTGYALGQTKKYGIKGERYSELCSLCDFIDSKVVKLSDKIGVYFDDIKEFTKDFKYVKFVMSRDGTNKNGNDNFHESEYVSILGRLFHGTVTCEYFIDKIQTMKTSYGNRTKAAVDGVDTKALSHAFRILCELESLIDEQFIRFPLKQVNEIKFLKYGKFDQIAYSTILDELEQKLDVISEKLQNCDLPEKLNRELLNNIIILFVTEGCI